MLLGSNGATNDIAVLSAFVSNNMLVECYSKWNEIMFYVSFVHIMYAKLGQAIAGV